jgi:hypothetical protein
MSVIHGKGSKSIPKNFGEQVDRENHNQIMTGCDLLKDVADQILGLKMS